MRTPLEAASRHMSLGSICRARATSAAVKMPGKTFPSIVCKGRSNESIDSSTTIALFIRTKNSSFATGFCLLSTEQRTHCVLHAQRNTIVTRARVSDRKMETQQKFWEQLSSICERLKRLDTQLGSVVTGNADGSECAGALDETLKELVFHVTAEFPVDDSLDGYREGDASALIELAHSISEQFTNLVATVDVAIGNSGDLDEFVSARKRLAVDLNKLMGKSVQGASNASSSVDIYSSSSGSSSPRPSLTSSGEDQKFVKPVPTKTKQLPQPPTKPNALKRAAPQKSVPRVSSGVVEEKESPKVSERAWVQPRVPKKTAEELDFANTPPMAHTPPIATAPVSAAAVAPIAVSSLTASGSGLSSGAGSANGSGGNLVPTRQQSNLAMSAQMQLQQQLQALQPIQVSARFYHCCCYDRANQRVLMCGGIRRDKPTRLCSSQVYSLTVVKNQTPFWSALDATAAPGSQSPPALCWHSGVLLEHSKWMIFGGKNSSNSFSQSAYVLDLNNMTWSLLPGIGDVPAPRGGHSMLRMPDGDEFVLFGGMDSAGAHCLNDVYVFSKEDMSWRAQPTSNPPPPRFVHGACIVQRKMWILGGLRGSLSKSTPGNDLWCLDLESWEWSQPLATGSGPENGTYVLIALDGENGTEILCLGSKAGEDTRDVFYVLTVPETAPQGRSSGGSVRWTRGNLTKDQKPGVSEGHCAFVMGNSVYIIGGRPGEEGSSEIEYYVVPKATFSDAVVRSKPATTGSMELKKKASPQMAQATLPKRLSNSGGGFRKLDRESSERARQSATVGVKMGKRVNELNNSQGNSGFQDLVAQATAAKEAKDAREAATAASSGTGSTSSLNLVGVSQQDKGALTPAAEDSLSPRVGSPTFGSPRIQVTNSSDKGSPRPVVVGASSMTNLVMDEVKAALADANTRVVKLEGQNKELREKLEHLQTNFEFELSMRLDAESKAQTMANNYRLIKEAYDALLTETGRLFQLAMAEVQNPAGQEKLRRRYEDLRSLSDVSLNAATMASPPTAGGQGRDREGGAIEKGNSTVKRKGKRKDEVWEPHLRSVDKVNTELNKAFLLSRKAVSDTTSASGTGGSSSGAGAASSASATGSGGTGVAATAAATATGPSSPTTQPGNKDGSVEPSQMRSYLSSVETEAPLQDLRALWESKDDTAVESFMDYVAATNGELLGSVQFCVRIVRMLKANDGSRVALLEELMLNNVALDATHPVSILEEDLRAQLVEYYHSEWLIHPPSDAMWQDLLDQVEHGLVPAFLEYEINAARASAPTPVSSRDRTSSKRHTNAGVHQLVATAETQLMERLLEMEKDRTKGADEGEDEAADEGATLFKKVTSEMVATEINYVTDLKIITTVFRRPLMEEKSVITPLEAFNVFANIEDVYALNRKFLTALQKEHGKPLASKNYGKVFLEFAPQFQKIYLAYASRKTTQRQTIDHLVATNKKFVAFLEDCFTNKSCRRLELKSFLIKPVQRICKYPLLLRTMVESAPRSYSDKPSLTEAKKRMEEAIGALEEQLFVEDDKMKLLELEGTLNWHREPLLELVVEGRTIVYDSMLVGAEIPVGVHIEEALIQSMRNFHLYLLTDILLIVEEVEKKGAKTPILQSVVGVAYCVVIPIHSKAAFQLVQPQQDVKYIFRCGSQDQKLKWIKELSDAILEARQKLQLQQQAQ